MLKLFKGREDINKEKYIYEHIDGETLVIVPDQYTLIAEVQALKYMQAACLLDVEILSMSRLGLRMLQEQGLENVPTLDSYERYMMLARIVQKNRENLEIFRKSADKKSFIGMIDDFIADFKQQDCDLTEMTSLLEDSATTEVLRMKLREISSIVEQYQSAIDGKYADNEDYIAMYIEAISKSTDLRGKNVWVYGYDSMTPKFADAITEVAKVAKDVAVVVNVSDFGLDRIMVKTLADTASAKGIKVSEEWIHEEKLPKTETLQRIERDLFAPAYKAAAPSDNFYPEDLKVVECANPYFEAESATIYIYKLLHEGYEMKDIVIIANDAQTMQPIIKRTFDEYGLPLFLDARRGVRDSQAVSFVMNLLDLVQGGYRTAPVLALLKSGLAGVSDEDTWLLENYAKAYNIRGTMWERPFRYGTYEYREDEFAKLESIRGVLVRKIDALRDIAEAAENVKDFTEKFYLYLLETWELKSRIQEIQDDQHERKLFEEAQWTAQSYNAVIRILDCVRDILGEDPMDIKEFYALYAQGILNKEVGMIPPTKDGLSIGTMIRSRTAPPRAVVIVGANEGVLPMEPAPEGLFSVDEKAYFAENAFPLGRLDELQLMEENAAMYRTVSRASERLYISYSLADSEGKDMKRSTLIDSLKELFPTLDIERDVVSGGFGMELVQNGPEALRHMMNHFKERPEDIMAAEVAEAADAAEKKDNPGASPAPVKKFGEADYIADAIMRWYEKNDPDTLAHLVEAGCDENNAAALDEELARRLYARRDGEVVLSPSKLEKYDHCPFEFYVMHGLRAEEPREFKSTGREIGDVYHECIMRVSKRLMDAQRAAGLADEDDGIPTLFDLAEIDQTANYDDNSEGEEAEATAKPSFEDYDIAKMVDEELTRLSTDYRGGLFLSGGREEYRMQRIREVCEDAVRSLAKQLANGQLELAFFEEKFGRGCRFEPIEYTLHGQKVYIEGKIDRVDILRGGNARIIDYKTGPDKLDIEQMRIGYKMQLMVYLQGVTGTGYEPAGMFYFNIADKDISVDGLDEKKQAKKLESEKENKFKLNGVYIDEPAIAASMPLEVLVKNSPKLPREDFEQLELDVHKSIERLSDGIVNGTIPINPTRLSKGTKRAECQYCQYRSICKFDLSYRQNRYRMV